MSPGFSSASTQNSDSGYPNGQDLLPQGSEPSPDYSVGADLLPNAGRDNSETAKTLMGARDFVDTLPGWRPDFVPDDNLNTCRAEIFSLLETAHLPEAESNPGLIVLACDVLDVLRIKGYPFTAKETAAIHIAGTKNSVAKNLANALPRRLCKANACMYPARLVPEAGL